MRFENPLGIAQGEQPILSIEDWELGTATTAAGVYAVHLGLRVAQEGKASKDLPTTDETLCISTATCLDELANRRRAGARGFDKRSYPVDQDRVLLPKLREGSRERASELILDTHSSVFVWNGLQLLSVMSGRRPWRWLTRRRYGINRDTTERARYEVKRLTHQLEQYNVD